jgi:hypothetical protein
MEGAAGIDSKADQSQALCQRSGHSCCYIGDLSRLVLPLQSLHRGCSDSPCVAGTQTVLTKTLHVCSLPREALIRFKGRAGNVPESMDWPTIMANSRQVVLGGYRRRASVEVDRDGGCESTKETNCAFGHTQRLLHFDRPISVLALSTCTSRL